jgi:UMF1 family MFS transporter
VYFREALVGAGQRSGDFLWALGGIAVNAVVLLISPVLGAVADFSGRKKAFLRLTVAVTVLGTAGLALLVPGSSLTLAVLLYVLASTGFEAGYVFYNAFLPEVSTPATAGRISSLAWAVGFIGGLASLLACSPCLATPLTDASGELATAAVAGYRTSFLIVAGFFALFSLPTLLLLRETPARGAPRRYRDYVAIGFARVRDTLTHLAAYRDTATFVIAYVFFFGGIATVIRFSAIFASQTFDIRGAQLVALFVVTNIIAVPGTLAAGWLADRIGHRRALAGTLLLWVGVALLGAFARGTWAFWIMAAGASIGMGSSQSIGRALMARLTPKERESEFFGFYVMAAQVGSILAYLTFGAVSSVSGDQRLAVLWTVPFFAVGLALILWIREDRGAGTASAR